MRASALVNCVFYRTVNVVLNCTTERNTCTQRSSREKLWISVALRIISTDRKIKNLTSFTTHYTHQQSQKEYTQDSRCTVKLIMCNGATCMWMGGSSACAGICHDLADFREVLGVFMLSTCAAQASKTDLQDCSCD